MKNVWILIAVALVGIALLFIQVMVLFVEDAKSPPMARASLKDSWQGRSLTFRPDGCVELRANHGFRSFVFQDRRWRECPRKP